MRRFLPLIIVEVYLLLGLFLLYLGPVRFELHNSFLFILLLLLYHLAFVFGYFLSLRLYRPVIRNNVPEVSGRVFYLLFILGIASVFLSYKNLMMNDSLIPYNIASDIVRGLVEPGVVYAERMQRMDEAGGSRILNVASLFFSFTKFLFLFYVIYFWSSLSFWRRVFSVVFLLLFPLPGIVSGTNSLVFYFFIFIVSTVILVLYIRGFRYLKFLLVLAFFIMLIPIGSFGYIMSQRGGGFEYFALTSPLGDISVLVDTPDIQGVLDYYYYSLVWLNYYLVQGYYGFSLILSLDWDWTFGFGNSAFAQRQLLMLTGVDVSGLTFQRKITDFWDESAQWHSFYGQMANDFGLVGLSLFMLIWGFFLSRVWLTVLYEKSFYGAALIPMFVLWLLFVPANNQILGFIDTLSFMMFVSVFWLMENKKVRF